MGDTKYLLLDSNPIEHNTYVPYAFTRMRTYQESPEAFGVFNQASSVYKVNLVLILSYIIFRDLIGEIEELR